MAAITAQLAKMGSGYFKRSKREASDGGNPRFKVGYVTLPATADNGDTVTIDMYEKFGITKLLGVIGKSHTTEDSVIVEEHPTTAVKGTDLTLTVAGSTANLKRFFEIYGI